ncbi:saxiphilin isoform X2 [Galendromus occidentalis]|nr:saxiphilin isoform X2 [Galendromus occidentalis]XP_028968307.1 saxiphilin isoform X2 [Galendromus occidentalis]
MLGVFVPECEDSGEWKALQCHASTGMCRCVHPTGENLKNSSRVLETCVCIVHRDRQMKKGLLGAAIPACEESGYYKKVQCHEARCSCADPTSGELRGESRHISELSQLEC